MSLAAAPRPPCPMRRNAQLGCQGGQRDPKGASSRPEKYDNIVVVHVVVFVVLVVLVVLVLVVLVLLELLLLLLLVVVVVVV